ncbi:MFS transporter [Paraburkholderia sp. CNPSo 3157]|uniref:MFS transporter n=1 Tax=Paraburkholderia franconis TaxID=2654983 RepID=A0A7X1NJP1_9BURK|nr:MFS transporter [Paraburkholderia franconis]MPW23154.1 MFS transporter [Paraburkholderia franconis]
MSRPVSTKALPALDASSKVKTAASMWVVCGAAIGLMFGFGPLFFSVIGIFLKPMTVTFGWGRSDVAMLPMLAMAGTALGAPVAGYLADRIGWSKVIAGAIALFSMSLGALALAPANHAYVAVVGFLIGFLGAATTAAGYLAVLPRVFDKRLGMALGFAMIGTGLGGFFAPIAANRLGVMMDWRHSFAVCALAALVFGIVAHRLLFRNVRIEKSAGASVQTASLEAGLTLGEAVRGYRFWLLAVVMFVISSAILGGFVHLAAFVSDRGLGRDVGAQAAGVVGAGLAIARVGLGALLDRVFAPFVALVSFGIGAVGFAIFLTDAAQMPAMIVLAALLLGISTGSEGDLIPFLARKYFGKRSFGSIYGCLFGAATLGGAVGPFLYGLAFDRFGSYTVVHEVSCAACIVGAVAILLLGRYPAVPAGDEQ